MVMTRWLSKSAAKLRRLLFQGWQAIYRLFIKSNRYMATHQIVTGYAQHIGKREEQQDAYGFSSLEDQKLSKGHGLLAVLADGMGGYEMGKEAGQLAVETMLSVYAHKAEWSSVPEALELSMHFAGQAVYELALEHKLEWHVGTTLVATVIREGQLHWISVGDSRIYLYRSGVLVPLTRDHIYANRLYERVLAGKLTLEEAESHPDRYLLTSYLGIPSVTEIDASQKPLKLQEGDWVLLCSDGLYEDLTEELLEEAANLSPQDAADYILQYVLEQQRPYQDNATLLILAYTQA